MKADAATDQAVVMALAHLAVERPGWRSMLRDIAIEFPQGDGLFDRFEALRRAHLDIVGAEDSIVQLRRVVEAANPFLWEMVREIAWPGVQG